MEFSMEEFSSNESGWTKYLGSPSEQEDNYSSGVEDGDYSYYRGHDRASRNGRVKKGNEDDDSITSDASSGPRSRVAGVNGGGCSSNYNAKEEDEGYYCGKRAMMGEKPCKEVKGKAGKVSTMVSKAKGALKQKRGKKAN